MIASLQGKLESLGSDWAIINVGGIGFQVYMPTSVLSTLGATGDDVKLYTHLHLREDNVTLYGNYSLRVAWIFDSKGVITIKTDNLDADELALIAIDAGAEDVKVESDYVEVYTKPEELETVRTALEQQNLTITTSELSMVPKTLVPLDEKAAMQALKLLDKLEEIDEVQNVFSNADFPDSVLESYQSQ